MLENGDRVSSEEDNPDEFQGMRWGWKAIALGIFCISLITPFHQVWQQDIRAVVPLPADYAKLSTANDQYLRAAYRTDVRLHVSVVGHHVRSLITNPRFRDYLVGSVVGLIPPIAVFVVFFDAAMRFFGYQ